MRIAWHYLVQYLKVRISYRWDFLAEFLGELVGTAAGLAFLVGVFAGAGMPAIAGWPRDAVLFMYGFSMIGYGCFELFAEAFYRFSDHYLIEGRFDQVLLKPFSPLLQVLLAGFNPMAMTEGLLGLGLMVWSGDRLGVSWGFWQVWGAVGLALSAGVILVSVFLALTCVSFWFEDRLGIQPPIYNCIVFGRYPIETFHPVVRFLLRWVIPFAFIGYYPGGLFVAGDRWTEATRHLALATPLVALACATAAGLLWRAGVRRYHSTGS
jgi:ABC-2 type transport system permease protein